MRIDFVNRLRRKIKAAGSNGEYRDNNGVFTWLPRADSTALQITTANAIVASYDDAADLVQQTVESRALAVLQADDKIQKAVVLVMLDDFNRQSRQFRDLLAAIAAATSLANLQTRAAAITPVEPARTAVELHDAVVTKLTSGAAD